MMETESGNSTTLMEPRIVLFLYYGGFLLVDVICGRGRTRPYP
jgi:hypothetical protein